MNYKIIIPAVLASVAAIYYRSAFRIKNIISSLPRSAPWPERPVSSINDITIHHSASTQTATAYDFAKWHINEKGWPGIGYHFVVNSDGKIDQTNPLNAYSYHNGYDNKGAIGVCLVGNFDKHPPTPEQLKSLIRLIRFLKSRANIKTLTGHKEYPGASTICPGRYMPINEIRKRVNLPVYGSTKKQAAMIWNSSGKGYEKATADN